MKVLARTIDGDIAKVQVEKGDTLWEISNAVYKDPTKYPKIAALNDLKDPDKVADKQILITDPSAATPKTHARAKAEVDVFGLQSDADDVLLATWTWDKDKETESYKVLWTYLTADGIWFQGRNTEIPVDEDAPNLSKVDTFNIPSNAKRVKFKVKPISKKKDDKNKSVYWTADWSTEKTHTVGEDPPEKPGTPNVKIDKYQLTATLDNLAEDATHIKFQIVKNNSAHPFNTSEKITIVSRHASYTCKIDLGGEYKVRCQAIRGALESEWSDYTTNVGTIPATPSGAPTCTALSESSVRLKWGAVTTATSYDIEYANKKEYFDNSDQTTTKGGIEDTHYDIYGLEPGNEYFFRVRAVNDEISDGVSSWSAISSVVIGKDPIAPTTWSSSTTVITGEPLILYWVHNSEDGSSQTFADLEIYVDGFKETHTIENPTTDDDDERDKTSSYTIDTSEYIEGTTIEWRVKTAGITKKYGDWSVQRTVKVYAPATLELQMTDSSDNAIGTLHSFPFHVYALAGPESQVPIGYHVTITSNESYETVDNLGNDRTVTEGEEVYSKYFDINGSLDIDFSANNVDLENNIAYTLTCTVAMDSGLNAESSVEFTVSWVEQEYQPNAEIGVDQDTMTAYIRPYCENGRLVYYRVDLLNGYYLRTDEVLDFAWGEPVKGATVVTGERVYQGVDGYGNEVYYCTVEEKTEITNVLMSVYRREFDGSFTELATGLDVSKHTTITDPHPALDFARYRIVAVDKATGAVSYYDPPGYPVGGKEVIIQWAEDWTTFETTEDAVLAQPPWAGSLLKLPYNIDVSDNSKPDVALIEYIGRSHPISYYGTQLGSSATWSVEIDKSDEETLYALRRLARWMGDVYVREPSGSGYWANITVSFSQKHCEVTIPVTLEIARVEGGA